MWIFKKFVIAAGGQITSIRDVMKRSQFISVCIAATALLAVWGCKTTESNTAKSGSTTPTGASSAQAASTPAAVEGSYLGDPSRISNGVISNPDIGFNGYEVKIPAGYTAKFKDPVGAPSPIEEKRGVIARMNWAMPILLPEPIEFYPLVSYNGVLIFGVFRDSEIDRWAGYPKEYVEQYLNLIARRNAREERLFDGVLEAEGGVARAGSRGVGRIYVHHKDGLVYITFFTVGKLREVFMIRAIAHKADQAQIEKDALAMLESLNVK